MISNVDINEELIKGEILDKKVRVRSSRVYFYWLLLRRYGPVSLIPDGTIGIDETYIGMFCPRATYDEVVDYTNKEMILAANDLPDR